MYGKSTTNWLEIFSNSGKSVINQIDGPVG